MMEIVEAAPRRRQWSQAEKEQLVAETCEPGVSVLLVARRREVDPSLLFRWHRQLLTPAEPPPVFAPVEVADTTLARPFTPLAPCGAGLIEIELAGGRRLNASKNRSAVDAGVIPLA